MKHKETSIILAASALLAVFASLPSIAQERGARQTDSARENSTRNATSTLSRAETEDALIKLLGEEEANKLLKSMESTQELVSPDNDDDLVSPPQRHKPGLHSTLRELKRSLSERSRQPDELNNLLAKIDAAELALLGLAEEPDPTNALNRVMSALYDANREGTLSRAQSNNAAKNLSDAVYRDRKARLQFAVSRNVPGRVTAELRTDIDNIKDIVARVGGDESPPPFPNLKFGDAFDIDAFRTGVTNAIGPIGQITGEAAGYAFSVWRNGEPYYESAGGKARRPSDQPDIAQSPDKPLNVASTAKVLTSIAALKLLEGKSNVNLDTSIQYQLPAGWSKGAGLNTVSFRDLLTYCSGFLGMQQASADSYNDLKAIIAAGVNSNFCEYENANFGMFRVLIPTMTGNDPSDFYGPIQPLIASVYYADWVRDNVLSPAGVSAGLCEDTTSYPTMYYRISKPATASGQYKPKDLLLCGGGGWYLSANDWSRFLSYVRHSDYLSKSSKKALYGDPLGFALNEDSPGMTWSKGGSWTTGEGAVRTCIFQSWNGVTATLLFNSDTKTINPCGVLRDAFTNAWSFN